MLELLKSKIPLIALAAWCVAMLAVRMIYSGGTGNSFLLWNLALASVPVLASAAVAALVKRPGTSVAQVIALCVWLAFLPNAPYLVTDLVHLRPVSSVPYWYDVALFGSYAATGAVFAYASVAEIESVLRRWMGGTWALVASVLALLLAGFGIYLGRFMRFNSWDVLTAPHTFGHQVARHVANPATHPASWEVPTIYGVGLVLGYLALRSVAPLLVPPGSKASNKRVERDGAS